MNDSAIYYFGWLHLFLYAGLGFSFVCFCAARLIGGIAKLLWAHRNDALPRLEHE